jgi:Zn finger protein HypA/HybF involved in hydrogenase expression
MVERRVRVACRTILAGVVLLCAGCWGSGDFPPLERHRIGASNHGPLFPIGAGVPHQGLDCQDCHGGTASFSEYSCITCHDHAQEITDPQHLGIPDYAYGPSTCYGCHPNGTIAGVDHASFFPISGNVKHADIRCASCHPSPIDRRIFTCTGCHDHRQEIADPGHANVPDYAYADSACYGCHPTGETISRAQHTAFFPILAGAHAVTTCAECHTVPGEFRAYECIDCHDHRQEITDPAHADVPGYSFVSTECYRCHPTGESISREAHDPFFPILTGRHGGMACSECHTTPGTFQRYECNLCHTHECGESDREHREVSGYSCVSTECYRCHPRGTEEDF